MTSDPREGRAVEEVAHALDRSGELDEEELRRRLGELGGPADELVRAAARYRELLDPSPAPFSGPPSIRPGDRFGDFEVVDFIGRGAVGEVFLARQTSLGGRRVALKILREGSRSARGRRRFEYEALVLADLHHPNLAEIYCVGEDGGHPFLAMQLVEGPTLREVIAGNGEEGRERIPLRRRVSWIAEVADALAAVHRLELVHRDVKPGNILVEGEKLGDSRAVLVDFGLVRSGSDPEAGGDSLRSATFAYASPEQLLGLEVGAASDVFSLGVTMHDLIVECGPEQRKPASLGLSAPVNLDLDLAAILERATDPEQAWRYPDAGAMAEDLHRWLSGSSVSARRPPLLERLRRGVRDNAHRLLRLGAIVAVLALLILSSAAAVRWTRDRDEARQAERALAVGDVGRFAEHAGRVLPLWWGSLCNDPLALRAMQDLDDERSNAAKLVRHLRAGDALGAQWHAARCVRVNGPLEEPLAVRFLEGELCDLARAGSVSRSRGSRSKTLLLLMRVLFERPPASDEEYEAWKGVRPILRDLLADSAIGLRDNRLMAASALAGCGELADAEQLLEWALASPPMSEERRLGTSCVERIVRRLQRTGRSSELHFDRLWSTINTDLQSLLNSWPWVGDGPRPDPGGGDIVALAGAVAFAERMATGRTTLDDRLPELREGLVGDSVLTRTGLFELVSAAGDEARARELLQLPMSGDRETAGRVGRAQGACGVPGSPEGQCEEWIKIGTGIEAERRKELAMAFMEGVIIGRERRAGIAHEEAPDADSLLGAGPEPLPERELPCVEADISLDEEGTIASWRFDREQVTLSGLATAVRVRGAEHQEDEHGGRVLICRRFGASELHLSWNNAGGETGDLELELSHLSASRCTLPFTGDVQLEVELDGVLQNVLRVEDKSYVNDRVAIPASRVTPGSHEITLRLNEWTTTTYRLTSARLVRSRQ